MCLGHEAVRARCSWGRVNFGWQIAAEQILDLNPFSVGSRRNMVVDASRECDRRSAPFRLFPGAYNRIALVISNCSVKQLSNVRLL
jgi:hypothetical protein